MFHGDQTYDDQITVCTAKGRLTFPEIRTRLIDLGSGRVTPRVLCDLTQATVADLTTGEIEEIIKLVGQLVTGRGGGKAAIIARGGVDYGLARMFITFVEIAGLPIEARVFRTAEVATGWLKEPLVLQAL